MRKSAYKTFTVLLLGVSFMLTFSARVLAEEEPVERETIIDVDENGSISFITPEVNDISDELKAQYDRTDEFEVVSTIGNYKQVIGTYDTYEEAKEAETNKKRSRSVGDVSIEGNGLLRSVKYGVVDFNTGKSTTTFYENANKTGAKGYLSGSSQVDGAYLETSADGTMVKFRMSGITAWVSIYDVILREFDGSFNSYYKVFTKSNVLCHYISLQGDNTQPSKYSGGVVIGDTPSYIQPGVDYYSYDGVYFYTNYDGMIEDYRTGSSAHAVNASNPYYNYFQNLSFRTKTNFTAAQLDNMVNIELKLMTDQALAQRSVLRNTGSIFINQQNNYGVNAAMMISGGAIESAWGTSPYAIGRKNLFGHQAYDSNPDLASEYPSIEAGILAHAKAYLSDGYLNPQDSRYHGPQFGNKNGGMNYSYASDPNLGEKYASIYYDLEYDNGRKNVDYGKYTIGLTTGSSLSVRKEPTTNSTKLYTTSSLSSQPVIILEKVTGESVNGNNIWYKIQSDAVLKSDRSGVQGIGKYDFNRDYAYVSSAYIKVIFDEKNITGGLPTPSYIKGDVNSNGKIDAADYLMVMDSILGKYTMNDLQKKAADVNGNSKVDAADYLMIMDCILGKITIN